MSQYPQYPQYPQYQSPYQQMHQKDSSLAIVSLIFGILTWTILIWIAPLGAIVAVITGHLGKNEIDRSRGRIKGSGMATAGLIMGYIQLGLAVLGIIGVLIFLAASGLALSDLTSQFMY